MKTNINKNLPLLAPICLLFFSLLIMTGSCDSKEPKSHPLKVVKADVPEQFRRLKNSFILTNREIVYFQKQFSAQCARCHGELGDGGGDDDALEKYPPANLTDQKFLDSRTDGELFYQILVGGEELSAMPPFGPDSDIGWSEDKIWKMVAFVRSLAK